MRVFYNFDTIGLAKSSTTSKELLSELTSGGISHNSDQNTSPTSGGLKKKGVALLVDSKEVFVCC